MTRRSQAGGDRGAAALAAVALSTVVLIAAGISGQMARAALMQYRIDATADLVALSGAHAVLALRSDPCAAAAAVAESNAAQLLGCDVTHDAGRARILVEVRSRARVWPMPNPAADARAGLLAVSEEVRG